VLTWQQAAGALCLLQANAVSDKVLDLRKCDFTGKNLSGKTLAGALLSETNMSNANLQEAVLTKVGDCCASCCNVAWLAATAAGLVQLTWDTSLSPFPPVPVPCAVQHGCQSVQQLTCVRCCHGAVVRR